MAFSLPAATAVGNKDPEVSNYLKVWIVGSGEAFVGVIGPGTSKEIAANWASPFVGEHQDRCCRFVQAEAAEPFH